MCVYVGLRMCSVCSVCVNMGVATHLTTPYILCIFVKSRIYTTHLLCVLSVTHCELLKPVPISQSLVAHFGCAPPDGLSLIRHYASRVDMVKNCLRSLLHLLSSYVDGTSQLGVVTLTQMQAILAHIETHGVLVKLQGGLVARVAECYAAAAAKNIFSSAGGKHILIGGRRPSAILHTLSAEEHPDEDEKTSVPSGTLVQPQPLREREKDSDSITQQVDASQSQQQQQQQSVQDEENDEVAGISHTQSLRQRHARKKEIPANFRSQSTPSLSLRAPEEKEEEVMNETEEEEEVGVHV
jgi:hypothetical protein